TFASSSPKSKVIDAAYKVGDNPVSPQKPKVYLAFILIGLLLPFTAIYANQLMDNKIHNKVSLE
ncbi:MAG: hypothetical protein WA810_12885, partial [Maribacter sp.]